VVLKANTFGFIDEQLNGLPTQKSKTVVSVGVSDVPPVSDKGVPVQIVPYLISC
jgi:hypothetical protein